MTDLSLTGRQIRGFAVNAGGGGSGTLALVGGGEFRLDLATSIVGVGTITLQESQGESLWLRAGTSFTINVSSGAAPVPSPHSYFAIIGADNRDVVTLGSGTDTVYVGGPHETFFGGGRDTFYVNATSIGATIDGGSFGGVARSVLGVTGGGTETMGANITDISAVHLMGGVSGTTGYDFTANTTANLVIVSSRGNDVIHVGDASQRVDAGGSNVVVEATAGTAGVTVVGYQPAGADVTLSLSGGGVGVLSNADGGGLAIAIKDAMILDLGTAHFITATAEVGGNAIVAQTTYQTIDVTGGGDQLFASNLHHDTFAGTAAALQSADIHNFARTDLLHVTDLSASAAFSYSAIGGNEDLVHAGSHSFTLVNIAPTVHLTRTSDGSGGSFIQVG